MQKKGYCRIKPIIFRDTPKLYFKMWKILSKKCITTSKIQKYLSFRNIRIIFNVIEKNKINPFPINKTYNRNQ
jgi:hypothetical protein